MLALLTAIAIGSPGPAERDYRLTVNGKPSTQVALRADMPQGWIAAFCTAKVCAAGHVVVRIPDSGSSVVALHIYRIKEDAARNGLVTVLDDRREQFSLRVRFEHQPATTP